MAFMERANRVVLVNDFPSPVYMSNFAYLIPYQQTAYTSVYVNDSAWRFWSVTNLDGNYFVGTGCFHFLLRDASASYPASNDYSTTPSLCPADEVLKVAIINKVTPFKNVFSCPSFVLLPTLVPDTPMLQNKPLYIRCFTY